MSEPKTIELEELQQHTARDDIWLLVNGKVYNVTSFLDEHPGGDEVLLEEAELTPGRDATEAFEDVGHSDEARDMLKKLYVGDFKGEVKAKKTGASTTTASGTSSSASPFRMLLPVAILGAWIAWRMFFA